MSIAAVPLIFWLLHDDFRYKTLSACCIERKKFSISAFYIQSIKLDAWQQCKFLSNLLHDIRINVILAMHFRRYFHVNKIPCFEISSIISCVLFPLFFQKRIKIIVNFQNYRRKYKSQRIVQFPEHFRCRIDVESAI